MKDVPGVDAESVRTVVSRTENQPLHDPQSPLGRIDLEALAAAEPVVGVKAGRLDDANLAPHLTLLSSTERPFAQSRSRSAKLVNPRERLLPAVAQPAYTSLDAQGER